ncbi:MAG: glycine zipper 2TM domain-containing protein [Bacteroidaceae bacterium]|nr:glycine zipper 2TM domain-containing protein [Bacteroidaceae bacterium]
MKKVIITLVAVAMMLTSCGTMGLGTSMGAMIGGTLGSIAGDAAGGRHGSSLGGMIGSVAGMVVGAAIEEEQYRNRMEEAAKKSASAVQVQQSSAIEAIELTNFIYIDSDNDDTIEAGEDCRITFDVVNNGNSTIKNITPILELISETKGIKIGNPKQINQLSPNSKVTYSVPISANSHLKDGEADFRAYVVDSNGYVSESREFTLPTKK